MDSVLYQYRFRLRIYHDDTEDLLAQAWLPSEQRAYSYIIELGLLGVDERFRFELQLVYNRQLVGEAATLYFNETEEVFDGPTGNLAAQEEGEDTASITILEVDWPNGPMAVQEQGEDSASASGVVIPPAFDLELFYDDDDPEVDPPLQSVQDISGFTHPITGLSPSTTYKWRVLTVFDRIAERKSDWTLPKPFQTLEPPTGAIESGDDIFSATFTVDIAAALAAQGEGEDVFAASGSLEEPTIVGTLSVQETGDDALSASGAVAVDAALAAQEQNEDTLSGAASLIVTAALAAQEENLDAFAGTAFVAIDCNLAAQETTQDTASVTVTVTVTAVVAAQEELYDILAASGAVAVAASLQAQGQGQDAFSGTMQEVNIAVPTNLRVANVTRTTGRFEWDEPV